MTELTWLDNLTPKSARFDDTYYSRQNGLEETRYVFIDGNALCSRWATGDVPVIGELGFGTGLNFLLTMKVFGEKFRTEVESPRLSSTPHRFRFISVEKYPMQRSDLLKALSPWPELLETADLLAEQWQPDQAGWQRLCFPAAELDLFIGDATDALGSMPCNIDAWYLDGFNPKTNPDLWSLPLMKQVHAASNDKATLASYTAAGWVRRNLQEAGFEIAKRKGFGHKRDMITGHKV